MATQDQETHKLDIRSGNDEDKEVVSVLNLGGESPATGNPVVISPGLHPKAQADPYWHAQLLRENPPGAQVPAQDPTPLDEGDPRNVAAARGDQVSATGGPGAVRRLDDRTPDHAIESAARPYNTDTSARQVPNRKGTDTTEENEEGKVLNPQTEYAREHSEHTGPTDVATGASVQGAPAARKARGQSG